LNFGGITWKLFELEIIQNSERIEENQKKIADSAKYDS
jgi:hypothetical protein